MAFDFKENEALITRNQTHQRHHMDSGSESAFIGSWGSSSSSSFLTNSFGSELDSNDADLDDNGEEEDQFIAQLTRQMADYMLEENDDTNPPSKPSVVQKRNFQNRRSYADTVKKSIVGFQSDQSSTVDKQTEPQIQLYQVENQPQVGVQSGGGWGRRGKMSTESTQQQMKTHQMHNINRGLMNGGGKAAYSGGVVHGSSSGMRAIFLGGSGSRSVTSGTGVFLPRSATDATDQSRKKPGCSTALVPTRVLQALEQHFNNMESRSPSNTLAQTHPASQVKDEKQAQDSIPLDHQKSKLPQEWTY